MKRTLSFCLLAGILTIAAFGAASALTACKAVPRGSAAVGWRHTPELTGPAIDVGLGEYELKNPLSSDGPAKSAADEAKAKAASDAELKATDDAIAKKAADAQADADAKARAAAEAPAKVAAGTLSEADARRIQDASDLALVTKEKLVELQASFTALSTKYRDLDIKATALEGEVAAGRPGFIPKTLDMQGVVALAMAWGLWFVKSRSAKQARAEAEKAKADAIAHGKKALADFDALPETVKLLPDGSIVPA